MTHNLKVGDRVERVIMNFYNPDYKIEIGELGTVEKVGKYFSIGVKWDKYPYTTLTVDGGFLRKVEPSKSNNKFIETVPQPSKRIKEGLYSAYSHNFRITDIGSNGYPYISIDGKPSTYWSVDSLRSLAKQFNELADAMEEIQNG